MKNEYRIKFSLHLKFILSISVNRGNQMVTTRNNSAVTICRRRKCICPFNQCVVYSIKLPLLFWEF